MLTPRQHYFTREEISTLEEVIMAKPRLGFGIGLIGIAIAGIAAVAVQYLKDSVLPESILTGWAAR